MSVVEKAVHPNLSHLLNNIHLVVPLSVMGILLVMVLPMPPIMLDLLISLNITLSIVILLVSMYILQPVHFSVFPSLLLIVTLFRLALNVASTRLILLRGSEGTAAAGRVIESFGQFVVGGNYLVGIIVFIVLIGIQFIVINHGAVRISEVTARFTLDAMPGKQMSIDADLNAGLIDEKEARARREMIAREAEFYGAMDGAIRFTSRDAIASLLILGINIIGGFLIGVLQFDMGLADAAKRFTLLTVGDGLVTAIPSLLISVAAMMWPGSSLPTRYRLPSLPVCSSSSALSPGCRGLRSYFSQGWLDFWRFRRIAGGKANGSSLRKPTPRSSKQSAPRRR
jgi:flagellar biosynthesis protein FlhA